MSTLVDLLTKAGVKHTVEGDSIRVSWGLPGDRSHMAVISSRPQDLFGRRTYNCYLPVGPAKDAKKVLAACELMGRTRRGAIAILGEKICVRVCLPDTLDPKHLYAELSQLCLMADEFEKQLFGANTF